MSQTIKLLPNAEGWVYFSTYIQEEDSLVWSNALENIKDRIIIVKDVTGNIYIPKYNINTIGKIRIDRGYQIKIKQIDDTGELYTGELYEVELVFEGTSKYDNLSTQPIRLYGGWNIMPNHFKNSVNLKTMIQSIHSNMEMLKDLKGNIYYPRFGIEQINDITQGSAFKIKMNSRANLCLLDNYYLDENECKKHTNCNESGKPLKEAGSNTKDVVCDIECVSSWTDRNNYNKACVSWSELTCGMGLGFVEGTSTSDRSCDSCAVGFYSDEDSNTVCKPHTITSDDCNENTEDFNQGTKSQNSECIDKPTLAISSVTITITLDNDITDSEIEDFFNDISPETSLSVTTTTEYDITQVYTTTETLNCAELKTLLANNIGIEESRIVITGDGCSLVRRSKDTKEVTVYIKDLEEGKAKDLSKANNLLGEKSVLKETLVAVTLVSTSTDEESSTNAREEFVRKFEQSDTSSIGSSQIVRDFINKGQCKDNQYQYYPMGKLSSESELCDGCIECRNKINVLLHKIRTYTSENGTKTEYELQLTNVSMKEEITGLEFTFNKNLPDNTDQSIIYNNKEWEWSHNNKKMLGYVASQTPLKIYPNFGNNNIKICRFISEQEIKLSEAIIASSGKDRLDRFDLIDNDECNAPEPGKCVYEIPNQVYPDADFIGDAKGWCNKENVSSCGITLELKNPTSNSIDIYIKNTKEDVYGAEFTIPSIFKIVNVESELLTNDVNFVDMQKNNIIIMDVKGIKKLQQDSILAKIEFESTIYKNRIFKIDNVVISGKTTSRNGSGYEIIHIIENNRVEIPLEPIPVLLTRTLITQKLMKYTVSLQNKKCNIGGVQFFFDSLSTSNSGNIKDTLISLADKDNNNNTDDFHVGNNIILGYSKKLDLVPKSNEYQEIVTFIADEGSTLDSIIIADDGSYTFGTSLAGVKSLAYSLEQTVDTKVYYLDYDKDGWLDSLAFNNPLALSDKFVSDFNNKQACTENNEVAIQELFNNKNNAEALLNSCGQLILHTVKGLDDLNNPNLDTYPYIACLSNKYGDGENGTTLNECCDYGDSGEECKQDCVLGNWSVWSECKVVEQTCGLGNKTRNKVLIQEENQWGTCNNESESAECNIGCPCVVGEWSAWSECASTTLTCGQGTRVRERSITLDSHGGECNENLSQFVFILKQTRSEQACDLGECPVDCEVGQWSAWSECKVIEQTCGDGYKIRDRVIQKEPNSTGVQCSELKDSVTCNLGTCTNLELKLRKTGISNNFTYEVLVSDKSDGVLNEDDSIVGFQLHFKSEEQFSIPDSNVTMYLDSTNWLVESGNNIVLGFSSILKPLNENDSRIISFISDKDIDLDSATIIANINAEPVPYTIESMDCEVSEWSEWSCNRICGDGTQTRTRSITQYPTNEGTVCEVTEQHENCNLGHCPVDCVLSSWSNWGECDVTCGGGTQTRTRSVVTEDAHGGLSCDDSTIDSQACNLESCCTPDCNNKICGGNGCDGFCGNTPDGECANGTCNEGSCVCDSVSFNLDNGYCATCTSQFITCEADYELVGCGNGEPGECFSDTKIDMLKTPLVSDTAAKVRVSTRNNVAGTQFKISCGVDCVLDSVVSIPQEQDGWYTKSNDNTVLQFSTQANNRNISGDLVDLYLSGISEDICLKDIIMGDSTATQLLSTPDSVCVPPGKHSPTKTGRNRFDNSLYLSI